MHIQPKQEEKRVRSVSRNKRSLVLHRFYRLGLTYGRQVYRFRWSIIALWIVALSVSLPFAGQIGAVLQGGGYTLSGSESAKVSTLLTSTLHQPSAQLLVVFHANQALVSDPAYQQEVNHFLSRAHSFPHATGVTESAVGQDGRTVSVTVNLNVGTDKAEQLVTSFHQLLPSGASAGPAQAYLTGGPAIYHAITTLTQQDAERAEVFALPIALVVLLLVFGTLLAAAMPIVLALVAVPIALAIIYGVALRFSMSVFVLNIATIIGLGISIDYSLFMIRRYRDELADGCHPSEAMGRTIATSGEAILFSGLIVMIGFFGLLLMGIQLMTSLGIGGAVVVGTSVLGALTLLPALLGVLGQRINALPIPFVSSVARRFGHAQTKKLAQAGERRARLSFWQTWAQAVMRRPVLILLIVTAILVGLSWPVFSLQIGTSSLTTLPASVEARQGMDLLNAQFPETNDNPIVIVVQSSDGTSMLTAGNIARLHHLTQWVTQQAHVTGVVSLTQPPATSGSPVPSEQQLAGLYSTGAYQQNPALVHLVAATTNGSTTVVTVKTDAKIDSSEGKALIDILRTGDRTAAQGLTALVGGFQAISLDFNRSLYSNFPFTILFILGTTYLLLLLMFRSVLLPLKAVVMNVLSVGACYGVLVFIFQWGNLSTLLGFTSEGFLDGLIPILLFCILFGLSMDYEVFLLSRIREEWLFTGKNRWAVARGLEKTGGVITNAALLFIIVSGAFVFTSMVIMKEMGLGMAVAVLVDSTIIRVLLVPATMRLLGRWNWWMPGRALPSNQEEIAGDRASS